LHGDLLAVQVLPALVALLVHDREKLQRAQLVEESDRHIHFLNRRIGRPLADIGLTVDHGLGRNFLALEGRDFDVDAARFGLLHGDQKRQLVD
jgi:hypothetical protein